MPKLMAYTRMLADDVRMKAYAAALSRSVRPGATVVDIGTGTGAFAFMAARLGAGRVIALDPGDVLAIAREIAHSSGLADRVTFVDAASTAVEPAVPADVVVSDLRGALPFEGELIPSLVDARRRWLAPGGTMIPERDTVWVAAIRAPAWHEALRAPAAPGLDGVDLGPLGRRLLNRLHAAEIGVDGVALAPQPWVTLDYRTVVSPDAAAVVAWEAERDDVVHGLGLWFEARLCDGVGYATGPGAPRTCYGNVALPFERPIVLAPGTRLAVDLRATLVGGQYVWEWHTTVEAGGDRRTMRQSSFAGALLSPDGLDRHRARAADAGHAADAAP